MTDAPDGPPPPRPIGWTEMKRLLGRVAALLDPNTPVDMWIAGGSALAAIDLRLSTTDVDVVFDVPAAVYKAAREVAGDEALPPGWAQRERSCVSTEECNCNHGASGGPAHCPTRVA